MKILGIPYILKLVPHLSESGNLGEHHGATHEILLESGMDHDAAMATLIHEILEAINHLLELGLEHGTIVAIETGLASVLFESHVSLDPILKEAEKR